MRLLHLARQAALFSFSTLVLYLVYTFSMKVPFTHDVINVIYDEDTHDGTTLSHEVETLDGSSAIKKSPAQNISNLKDVNKHISIPTPGKNNTGQSWYEREPRLVSSLERNTTRPFLTLFTTFKETPDRINIQTNTILNWASLGPLVQPVAFVNSSEEGILAKRAREHGWVVVPLLRTNKYGTPFLKDMYRAVPRLSNSTYYGYSNADILFDEGLVKTMVAMKRYVLDFNSSLLIGRRKNVNIDPLSSVPLYKGSQIAQLARTKGKLFRVDAEDYFMIGRISRFPWHTIKDVVIGRPGYDNYLVGQAIKGKVAVIDVTNTVLAFHQTGKDGIFAGAHNKDGHYNHHIIGKYHYNGGLTTSGRYVSVFDARGDVFIKGKRR